MKRTALKRTTPLTVRTPWRWRSKQSTADKKWQKAVRERDNYTCVRCGIYDEYIDTHHIISKKQRPDLRDVVSNGVCLDRLCHQWAHNEPKEARKLGVMRHSWESNK